MTFRLLLKTLLVWGVLALLPRLSGADFAVIDATGGGLLALRRASFAFSRVQECTISVNRRDALWGVDKLKAGDIAVLVLDAADLPADLPVTVRMDLATEALVLYVNAENSLRQIKREAVPDLLVGAAPSWERLTGDPAGIHRYRVRKGAVGRGTAERMLKQGISVNFYELGTLSELLLIASTDSKSLVIGRYQDLYPEEMVPLAVDGVMPGLQSIRSGRYPFCRKIVLVSKLPKNDTRLVKFLEILRGRDFYDDLLEEGLLPSSALSK